MKFFDYEAWSFYGDLVFVLVDNFAWSVGEHEIIGVIVAFEKPECRANHLEHFGNVFSFEEAYDFFLTLTLRRPREIFCEPCVNFSEEVCVFLSHSVILDELPAHTEYAFSVHSIFCEFEALNA